MKKILTIHSLLLTLTAGACASCITDNEWRQAKPPHVPDGAVTFRISVPRGSMPATRALLPSDEYRVDPDDLWVLMFNSAGGQYLGAYRGKTRLSSDTGDGSITMDFEVTLPLGAPCNLMVVANAATILADCKDLLVAGSLQSDIEAGLTKAMTAEGWKTGTPSERFPMWGYAAKVTADDFGEGEGETPTFTRRSINLVRMVAKVDVALLPGLASQGKFVLETVRVYNYNTSGRLVPQTAGFDWENFDVAKLGTLRTPSLPAGVAAAPVGEPIVRSVDQTTPGSILGDIYLFEAAAGVPPSKGTSDYLKNPCLVVGGRYNGGNTTYYRIDFAAMKEGAWKYLPLMRNNSYSVNIEDVSAPGMASPQEALASIPVNIRASVVEWAGASDITTLLSNGVYMLGLSHDNFTLPKRSHTEASFGNRLTIVTDFGGGWSARVLDSETAEGAATPEWIRLSPSDSDGSTAAHPTDYPDGTHTTLLVDAMPDAPELPQRRTAWIHVTAGNLVYKVKVMQTTKEPYIKILSVGGEEISSLSFPAIDAPAGSFRVEWFPDNIPLEVIDIQSGDDPFEWNDPSHSLERLTADADGGYTYSNIDPGNYTAIFKKRGSNLIFVLPDSSGGIVSRNIHLSQGSRYGNIAMNLSPIADPKATPHTGTTETDTRSFTVTSTVSGVAEGGNETVYDATPWVAEFLVDGAWVSSLPAGHWLEVSRTEGAGSVAGPDGLPLPEVISFTVAPAEPAETGGMGGNDPKGSPNARWNLANAAGEAEIENTANCYIIDAPGWYSLPMVYGNSVQGGNAVETPYKATPVSGDYTILEYFVRHDGKPITDSFIYNNFDKANISSAEVVWEEKAGLISSVALDETKENLIFNVTPEAITAGNAVVAVKDASGDVMWSWHLWVTSVDVTDLDRVNGFGFMKYNLGWVAGDEEKAIARKTQKMRIRQTADGGRQEVFTIARSGQSGSITTGHAMYYQWGRKDPMPAWNVAGFKTAAGGTLNMGIKNPATFYYTENNFPYDWNTGPNRYNNLWSMKNDQYGNGPKNTTQVVKTVYDPSPVGFKMPPPAAMPVEKSGAFVSGQGQWFKTESGTTFYPTTGQRSSLSTTAGVIFKEFSGNYWTASPGKADVLGTNGGVTNGGCMLLINSDGALFDARFRAHGLAVRPVRDE